MKYFKPHKFPISTSAVTGFTEVRREYGTQTEGVTAGMIRRPVVRMSQPWYTYILPL